MDGLEDSLLLQGGPGKRENREDENYNDNVGGATAIDRARGIMANLETRCMTCGR